MHVMIDLETLSLRPRAHILEIAAVPFDKERVYTELSFQSFVGQSQRGRHICPETLVWWLTDDMDRGVGMRARQRMAAGLRGAPDLADVLQGLANWFERTFNTERPLDGVWAHGASGDLAWLRDAYLELDWPATPWDHHLERDTRTALMFHTWLKDSDWRSYEVEKMLGESFIKHAALHDATLDASIWKAVV